MKTSPSRKPKEMSSLDQPDRTKFFDYATKIQFDLEKYRALRDAYLSYMGTDQRKGLFTFEGRSIYSAYAKLLITYLAYRFDGGKRPDDVTLCTFEGRQDNSL